MSVGEQTPTRASDARDRDRVLGLAAEGLSIELIARAVSRSRYFVETTLDEAPVGRADVPYRYRQIRASADVAGRYRLGHSAEDIARAVGVSVTTVFEWLREDGVRLRGKSGPHVGSYADVLTREFLNQRYVREGSAAAEIAADVGCSESTVRNWLRRHGIVVRPMSARKRAYTIPLPLLDDVADGRRSVDVAAAEVGCSRSEFLRALRRSGRDLPRDRRPALTIVLLRRLYVDRSMSCPEIAAETGWAVGTVRKKLKEYGVPRRIGRPPLR